MCFDFISLKWNLEFEPVLWLTFVIFGVTGELVNL